MPNRKKRARRRQGGVGALLSALIVLLVLVAVALIAVLVYSDPFAPEASNEMPYAYSGALNFEEEPAQETSVPLVLGVTATPEPAQTPAPTATPEIAGAVANVEAPAATQNSEAENSENRLVPTPMPGDYFLPVFDRALRTPDDPAMIAITVDDCSDVDKMTQILTSAERYNAQLTLFPTGNALMKLGSGFRTCVNTLGYELENMTYDKGKKDYSLSSGELALQIWRQSVAASYALTRDYQQHFYRPTNQNSVCDQRTHFFIRKLGFYGVAGYTYSYKGHDLESLSKTLSNGNIYQFDMSDASIELFEAFLEEANRKGYRMVTMNELFGLDRNTVGHSLTIDQQTLPEMNDYVPTYYDLKLNDRANAVYNLQTRLMVLGYLTAQPGKSLVADGIYGADTSVAVSAFQAKVGLVGTGNADVETQQKLFAEDAPPANG